MRSKDKPFSITIAIHKKDVIATKLIKKISRGRKFKLVKIRIKIFYLPIHFLLYKRESYKRITMLKKF